MPNCQHLKDIKISRYRGFEDFQVKLGRINIVTGRNNVGKTSLLEALFLLSGFGNPSLASNAHVSRWYGRFTGSPDNVLAALWAPLFRNLDTSTPVVIEALTAQKHKLKLSVTLEQPSTVLVSDTSSSTDNVPSRTRLALSFDHMAGTLKDSKPTHAWVELDDTSNSLKHTNAPIKLLFPATIIVPQTAYSTDDVEMLAELRQRKQVATVVKALKLIEPNIRDLEDKTIGETPRIWADLNDFSKLVPLASLGAGINWLARMVMGMVRSQNGLVLIDEIGFGIHHTHQPELWRIVHEIARDLNVQVVATTHSRECVEAAADALKLDEGVVLHRIAVDPQGRRQCYSFGPQEVRTAIRHNMEMR